MLTVSRAVGASGAIGWLVGCRGIKECQGAGRGVGSLRGALEPDMECRAEEPAGV